MGDDPIQPNTSVSTRSKDGVAEHSLDVSSISLRDELGCPVVGMVASAGGLAAFTDFFEAAPPDTGAAFVVVPHLDATNRSLMVELLSRHTSMPVTEAAEGISVEVNHVYVIPPNHLLTIEQGRLRLSDLPISAGTQTAIDVFLRSLAADRGERAIGIVLSGTGSHGTLGIREIKHCGGMAMAQSPESAEFDQMPRSVIETGIVDFVLAPAQMPQTLLKYLQQPYVKSPRNVITPNANLVEKLGAIIKLIREQTKDDFSSYRKNTLLRRIERRMGLRQLTDMDKYLQVLREQPNEVQALCKDLLIGVTQFYREPEAFAMLEKEVIPALVFEHASETPIRVWVPSCATGEEAYSIAILLIEALTAAGKPVNFQVFANDINDDSIEFARRGVYPASISNDISPTRLKRFFDAEDDVHYRVSKQLRDSIVFSHQNLILDAPFSKIDLISCRNVLIYLEPEVQQKTIGLFHFALNQAGFLFLGHSETIGRDTGLFEAVSKKWRVYRRLGPASAMAVNLPAIGTYSQTRVLRETPILPPKKTYKELAEHLILSDYAPASALINQRHEILNVTGPLVNFLEFPAGEITTNLLSLARPGLRTRLRLACHKALKQRIAVSDRNARVKRDGTYFPCSISVRPVLDPNQSEDLMLVLLQNRVPDAIKIDDAESAQSDAECVEAAANAPLIELLEYELKTTREELQNTAEQMHCGIEELQSSNEELESSKEELQSLNEELNTVNAQLLEKVGELDLSNSELNEVLASTEIATLFLDHQLRVKRFTPPAKKLLHLSAADKGRYLRDLESPLIDQSMLSDCQRVLNGQQQEETEITTKDGQCFLRRSLPFLVANSQAEGVVVTFIDLTERKSHEAKQREQDLRFRKVFENVASGIAITNWEGVFEQCNPAYCELLGYTEEELRSTQFLSLVHPDDQELNREKLQQLKSGEKSSVELENRYIRKDGTTIWVHKHMSVLPDAIDRSSHLIKLVTNISLQRKAIEELQQSEEKTRAIVALLPSQIAVVDVDGIIVATNPAWDKFAAQNAGEFEPSGAGSSYFKVCELALSNTDDSRVAARIAVGLRDVLAGKSDEFRIEYPCHSASEKRWFLLQATPLKYGRGGAVVFHQNITDRVLSEQLSRYNENLLQLVMDHVPHYIYARNREGAFVFVNQYTAVQNGFSSPAEMVGRYEMECASDKRQAQSQAFLQTDLKVIETGTPLLNIEEKFIDWQGNTHIVDTSKVRFSLPVTDEPAVLGVSVDITERRLAEIKTQESAERLRSILSTAFDAIITINKQGIIDSANQATLTLFGYTRSELIGNDLTMLLPIPLRTEHDAYLQRFLPSSKAQVLGTGREITCRRKDGSTFPADLTVSIVDHLGLYTGILRDISSRKELEKHALEIAANEQRRIGLELHDGTQQELTGLLLYANALIETIESASTKQRDHQTDTAAVREFDDAAYNRLRSTASLIAKRLSEASQHVRDLAHGIMPVQIDAEGLRSALHELAEFTNSDSIHCRLESSGDFNALHNTTATHLYRIAQEALNNAIQHGAASQILISLEQDAQRISLEVADNGIGIDNTAIPRSGSPTAGMGLRTMEYRAGLIGGVIQIEKQPDGGTLVKCLISHEAANHG